MQFSSQTQIFNFGSKSIKIFGPDSNAIQTAYNTQKSAAYWAKIWPASIGLCDFLSINLNLIKDKKILELAAGLGLSGIYAAHFAQLVTITDIEEKASFYVKQSAKQAQLTNVKAQALDWKASHLLDKPDVILLSDVNYEPTVFTELQSILESFIEQETTIIISTPQRLVAKQFITPLLIYSRLHWSSTILHNSNATDISVFVLSKQSIV